jgi:hypothetical protein
MQLPSVYTKSVHLNLGGCMAGKRLHTSDIVECRGVGVVMVGINLGFCNSLQSLFGGWI